MLAEMARQLALQQLVAILGPQPIIDAEEQGQILMDPTFIVMMRQWMPAQMTDAHRHYPPNLPLAQRIAFILKYR